MCFGGLTRGEKWEEVVRKISLVCIFLFVSTMGKQRPAGKWPPPQSAAPQCTAAPGASAVSNRRRLSEKLTNVASPWVKRHDSNNKNNNINKLVDFWALDTFCGRVSDAVGISQLESQVLHLNVVFPVYFMGLNALKINISLKSLRFSLNAPLLPALNKRYMYFLVDFAKFHVHAKTHFSKFYLCLFKCRYTQYIKWQESVYYACM